MQPSKWDLVLGSKPVPLVEHLLDEAAKLFAKDLSVYAEAFRLTRLDLARDVDAYDDYFRNLRFVEAGLNRGDRPMLLFVSRFMTEQLLGLGESTEGKLNRTRLIDVLERTRRHFFAAGGGPTAASPL
jgi:hypothetical protein